jgi:hypothetical protein
MDSGRESGRPRAGNQNVITTRHSVTSLAVCALLINRCSRSQGHCASNLPMRRVLQSALTFADLHLKLAKNDAGGTRSATARVLPADLKSQLVVRFSFAD